MAEHLIRFVADSLRPDVDGEVALTMLMAGLHEAHQAGLEDAAHICEGVERALKHPGERHVVGIICRSIRSLQHLNEADHQADIHTW